MKNKIIYTLVSLLSFPGSVAYADTTDTLPTQGKVINFNITNPLNIKDDFTLIDVLNLIVDAVLYLAIPVIVILIIYAGLRFVMARGNSAEIEKAKQMFFYIIVGTAIILGAKVIVEIVQNTINSFRS